MPHRGIIVAPDQSNDVPLPEGVDPKNVEDIESGGIETEVGSGDLKG